MIRNLTLFALCFFSLILTACDVPDVPLENSNSGYSSISVAEVDSTGGDAAIFSITQVLESKYWFQQALDANKAGALLNFEDGKSIKYLTVSSRTKDFEVKKTYTCLRVQKLYNQTEKTKEFIITRNPYHLCGAKYGNTEVSEESTYRLAIEYTNIYESIVKSVHLETSNRKVNVLNKVDKYNENKLTISTTNSQLVIELVELSGTNSRMTSVYQTNLNYNGVYNLELENSTHYSKENIVNFSLSNVGAFEVNNDNEVLNYFGEKYLDGLRLYIPSMERYVACKGRGKCSSFTKYRTLELSTEISELNFISVKDIKDEQKVSMCIPVQGNFFVDYFVSSAKIPFNKGAGTINEGGVQLVKNHKDKPSEKLEAQWLNCINSQGQMPYIAEFQRLLIP